MGSRRFTELRVWQAAHQVTMAVYDITETFPAKERFRLVDQMCRAALSIPSSIAEGFGRRKPHDKARFYTIGKGSAEELTYHFILAHDRGYIKADTREVESTLDQVGGMLRRLIQTTLGGEDSYE